MSLFILANTFANNILPILLLGGAGFTLGKLLHVDARSLGRVVFYVFSPVLIFDLLVKNQLEWNEAASVIGFTVTIVLLMGALAFLFGNFLKLERPALTAVVITTMFANTGNYGLPLVAFAFGEKALSYAGVYFITTTFMFYTVGVLIASLGHMNLKESLIGLLKLPTLYAVLLAALVIEFGIAIPAPVSRAVDLAAGGTIPLMLVLLGVQMTDVVLSGNRRALSLSVGLRLFAAPLIGLGLAVLFGLRGFARQGAVTQASMPSMVSATVLAAEYQLDAKLIAAAVFVCTLLSPLTLTLLLVFLGN
ncbi:MAG: AEC family transporter [Chloroflexi bacterium]|nr:AEC family transporter [Chloroflexota bacterium]